MNSNSEILPVEIWHIIFSLACTDDGTTGRSLSLVSTYIREISAPFKYRSIAITHWSQIIAFSKIFCKLPASQKRTIFLFVHHPYPFLDVDGNSSPTTVVLVTGVTNPRGSRVRVWRVGVRVAILEPLGNPNPQGGCMGNPHIF